MWIHEKRIHMALLPSTKKILGLNLAASWGLCGICMCSLCLRGFFPVILASSHSPKRCLGFRLVGDSVLAVGVNGCLSLCVRLRQIGSLSRVYSTSHHVINGIDSSPLWPCLCLWCLFCRVWVELQPGPVSYLGEAGGAWCWPKVRSSAFGSPASHIKPCPSTQRLTMETHG